MIFLVLLLTAVVTLYLNLRWVLPGGRGKFLGLGILVCIFFSMTLRETLPGSILLTFCTIWMCQALWMFLLFDLVRAFRFLWLSRKMTAGAYRQKNARFLCKWSRLVLLASVFFAAALIALGVPHNDDFKIRKLDVELPDHNALKFLVNESGEMPEAAGSEMPEVANGGMSEKAGLEPPEVAGNKMPAPASIKPPEAASNDQPASAASSSLEFTAVFFSDIHFAPLFRRAKLERLVSVVDSIGPDFVLFGGDMSDVSVSTLNEWGFDSLMERLSRSARVAAVAVNGNHEGMQERNGSNAMAWLGKNGWTALDDSTTCFSLKEAPVCFTGRTDFMVARSRGVERKPLSALVPGAFDARGPKSSSFWSAWLLLDHQPKGIEPEYSGILPDFAFSGHTHDGQFFPGNLIIGLIWPLSYARGVLNGVPWLVSSGVDSWGPPVRVGSDTELWVVRFVVHPRK